MEKFPFVYTPFGITLQEYVLKVRWLDENQYCIFRRYSMFFDLQVGWGRVLKLSIAYRRCIRYTSFFVVNETLVYVYGNVQSWLADPLENWKQFASWQTQMCHFYFELSGRGFQTFIYLLNASCHGM